MRIVRNHPKTQRLAGFLTGGNTPASVGITSRRGEYEIGPHACVIRWPEGGIGRTREMEANFIGRDLQTCRAPDVVDATLSIRPHH